MGRLLKLMWALFISANVYDVIISVIAWHIPDFFEENWLIWCYLSATNTALDQPVVPMLETLVGVKLLFISGVYWFTRLFDYFKVPKFKWASLLPFVVISVLVAMNDTMTLLGHF